MCCEAFNRHWLTFSLSCRVCEIHHRCFAANISVEYFLCIVTCLGFEENQLYQRAAETHMIVRIGTLDDGVP